MSEVTLDKYDALPADMQREVSSLIDTLFEQAKAAMNRDAIRHHIMGFCGCISDADAQTMLSAIENN